MDKTNIMDSLHIAGTAAGAGTGVELIHQMPSINATGEVIKWVCQAIIAIISIWGVRNTVKKNKHKDNHSDKE